MKDVTPARFITWFQAQMACGNAGKRLLTNAEWQMAAAGTPTASCPRIFDFGPTGRTAGCISAWGAFDMVSNVSEWVADWLPERTSLCSSWGPFGFPGHDLCMSEPVLLDQPAALVRGGSFNDESPGVFYVTAFTGVTESKENIGFRCGR